MKWETQAGMPTKGLLYDQLREKLIECQEIANMMGHVQEDKRWYKVAESLQKTVHIITQLAQQGAQ